MQEGIPLRKRRRASARGDQREKRATTINIVYGSKSMLGETFMVKWRRREEVVGKEIIDGEAKKAGTAKDLAWSNEGRLAIVVETGREEESYLPFDQVEKIGDVVFIKASSSLESVPMKTCPVCKHKNLIDAKFCQKCGKTLEEKK